MRAPQNVVGRRGVAVLASGVVISLSALTTGLAPAIAAPDNDEVVTTTAVPEPNVTVAETAPTSATASQEAPAPATEVAPQPQAPVSVESAPAAEPKTQAPEPPKTSTVVETAEPVAPSQSEPTTSAAPATTTTANQPASSSSSAALAPVSETSGTPAPSGSTSTSAAKSGASETPTVSISQAAKEIETLSPQTLEAPVEDVQLARKAEPIVEQQPAPASEQDVAAFSNSIETSLKIPGLDIGTSAKTQVAVGGSDVELVSNVRQWRPDWIEYDEYYRPVILNPFRAPVRIAYMYDMAPRIVYIPPLARIVLEAAQFAAYSFTAAVLAPVNAAIDTVQALTNIAVGSFFGGGYVPGAGLPLPPPPPPVLRYDNVPVQVRYTTATYEPFRVRQIVDVGDDRQYGERKVLLDGATPAWGVWTQGPTGERQFEIHKTQQFPGLNAPAEAPLPGDYRLRLASDESSTGGLTGRDIFLMVAAGVIGTLGFGAIGLAFFLGRRRPEH